MNGQTRQFADMIETEFLRHGAGNLSPTYDQLARAWQDLTHASLFDSITFVRRSIDTVLRELDEGRAWSCVTKVTTTFYAADHEPDDTDWLLLLRCVAGYGKSQQAVGIHFHINGEKECWPWQLAMAHRELVEKGVGRSINGRLTRVAEAALQPPEVIQRLATARMAAARASTKEMRQLAGTVR